MFDSEILFWGGGVGKFSKYLFGWFDLRGDFFEYSKQSEES